MELQDFSDLERLKDAAMYKEETQQEVAKLEGLYAVTVFNKYCKDL
jgi:hypothetical protein